MSDLINAIREQTDKGRTVLFESELHPVIGGALFVTVSENPAKIKDAMEASYSVAIKAAEQSAFDLFATTIRLSGEKIDHARNHPNPA